MFNSTNRLGHHSRILIWLCLAITFPAWASSDFTRAQETTPSKFTDQQIEFFEKKVRPVLVEHCFECHGTDQDSIEGGLSVATRENILVGGDSGAAIELGKPGDSLLIQSIRYDGLYQMPPSSKLNDQDIAALTKWVEQGAPWPATDGQANVAKKSFDLKARRDSHWAWQPIAQVKLPPTNQWSNNPIDRFISERLTKANLTPAQPADKRTLIRRAYIDLIGLPPTKAQIASFLDDHSDNAFESVVDGLLSSPAFGERWARHWMDLVRYAETYGHEFDYPIPHAHQYRDYLIRAFNSDVPYDQLIQEHIAGDLLRTPRLNSNSKFNESAIGTGFWHFSEAKHGAVDSLGEQAGTIDNQIDVFTKSFLGMTVACARCHDHKFDAIPTSDYYSLVGFLKSSRREKLMLDPDHKIARSHKQASELLSDASAHQPTFISALKDSDVGHIEKYLAATVAVGSAIQQQNNAPAKRKNDDQKNKPPVKPFAIESIQKHPALRQTASQEELDEAVLARLVSAAFEKGTNRPEHPLFAIRQIIESRAADRPSPVIAFDSSKNKKSLSSFLNRSELFEDFNSPLSPSWQASGFAFSTPISDFRLVGSQSIFQSPGTMSSGSVGDAYFGVLRSPSFEIKHDRIHYRVRGKNVSVRLVVNGYYMDQFNGLLYKDCIKSIPDSNQFTWVTQTGDIKNHKGSRAHLEIIDHGRGFVEIDEIRFSNDGRPPQTAPFFDFAKDTQIDVGQIAKKFAHKLSTLDDPDPENGLMLASWLVQRQLIPILNRDSYQTLGSFENALHAIRKHDETVPPPMMALGSVDGPGETSKIYIRGNHKNQGNEAPRRFLSAIDDQLLNPANGSGRLQLANKITAKDNPLTSRVAVNRIWHHLFGRGIVASVDNFGVLGKAPTHPELLDYLARQFQDDNWSIKQTLKKLMLTRTYQMSSEVNLAALEIDPDNRLLHRANIKRMQGEVIRDTILATSGQLDKTMFGPPVPIHLTPFMTGRGRPSKSGPLDGNGRRSIYVAIRRNFLSPMMLAFDTPIPFATAGRRNQSNVPSQALILMNSPLIEQQSNRWAQNLATNGLDVESKIELIFETAFARPPSPEEADAAIEFVRSQAELLNVSGDRIADHVEIWQAFCHVVYNLKEFIFVQ